MRKFNGKKWATTTFMMLLMLLPASVALAQKTQTFQANGATAVASQSIVNGDQLISYDVTVVRNDQNGTTIAIVFSEVVNVVTGDFISYSAEGEIPSTAFKASTANASVSLDAGTLQTSSCSFNSGSLDCSTTPATGVISATWTSPPGLSASTFSSSGTFRQKSPSVTLTLTGTQTTTSALANVNFLGTVLSNVSFATVGTNHNATITISHQ